MLKTQFYRFMIFFLGQLPLGLLRAVGSKIGTLAWLSRSRMWLVTQENINLCYPELDAHRRQVLSKESLRESAKTMAETTFAWSRPPSKVLGTISEVVGQELVEAAKSANRGIVFVIPHLGNWEIINHYLGQHYGLTHMYQPNKNKDLSEYIQNRRALTGTQFVATDSGGVRKQMKILKSGGCIGVMPDQEPLVHTGRFAPFYGINALTNELVRGYCKQGAQAFVAVCVRHASGFKIQFDSIPESPPETLINQVNLSMEQAIRRNPGQYLWSYKRFRTRPDGELDYYQFDRHPLRTAAESVGLAIYSLAFQHLSPIFDKPMAKSLSLVPLLTKKRRKISRVNIALIKRSSGKESSLAKTSTPVSIKPSIKSSIKTTIQTAIEAPRIWHCSPEKFNLSLSASDESSALLTSGSLVLTPL